MRYSRDRLCGVVVKLHLLPLNLLEAFLAVDVSVGEKAILSWAAVGAAAM